MSEHRANRTPLAAPGQIDHHVADLSATIAADVPLRQVQETLAEAGQWLPIDGDLDVTVGQLVETNSSGPLRLGYGAWRDLLLGAQFTNGRGELITAGGRAVKNVAGYDLTTFMVGQRGVFGNLVTITTRTHKKPAGAIVARFEPKASLVHRLLPSPQRPQWTLLTPDALLCGYLGDERTLTYYSQTLTTEWKPVSVTLRALEDDVELRGSLWQGEFRASVPPARIKDFVETARPGKWVADAAFGVVMGSGGDSDAIRGTAQALGGTFGFTPRGSEAAGPRFFDVPAGPVRDLLERLKQSFDPDNQLAPLPWKTQTA